MPFPPAVYQKLKLLAQNSKSRKGKEKSLTPTKYTRKQIKGRSTGKEELREKLKEKDVMSPELLLNQKSTGKRVNWKRKIAWI